MIRFLLPITASVFYLLPWAVALREFRRAAQATALAENSRELATSLGESLKESENKLGIVEADQMACQSRCGGLEKQSRQSHEAVHEAESMVKDRDAIIAGNQRQIAQQADTIAGMQSELNALKDQLVRMPTKAMTPSLETIRLAKKRKR